MSQITVTKCMTTETAHRLCNYVGKCAHIHGHSYRWEVTAARVGGGISEFNAIAVDFGELKDAMKEVIYGPFDHALVLWQHDPMVDTDGIGIPATPEGRPQKVLILNDNPTAEVFAEFAAYHLQKFFSDMECGEEPGLASRDDAEGTWIDILSVKVWETADSYGQWSTGNIYTSATNLSKQDE